MDAEIAPVKERSFGAMMHSDSKETKSKPTETLHLYVAIRRKKDNPLQDECCFREIIRDPVESLALLKSRCKTKYGIWRIYKTVNARSVEKARKLLLQHLIIDHPGKDDHAIDSLWKSILMSKPCRAERKILLDVDHSLISSDKLDELLIGQNIIFDPKKKVKTPNGWHVIIPSQDTRHLQNMGHPVAIEVKADALVFVEQFEVDILGRELWL